jgi:CBS domain-containing protein
MRTRDAPVVDGADRLVGIVSEADLLPLGAP